MYIDIDEVRWDMPPDHNLNSSGEYRSMRWFTPIFPQRIMRHFQVFLQQIHSTRCLAGKNPPTSQRKKRPTPGTKMCPSFSAGDGLHIFELTGKKMTPPTCWWSTHVNLPYYQCILWLVALMIHLYSFQAAKIKWTPHCNPIFFAWLLSFHHMFLLEPPMAQFQNKTYPSKSLVRSTHVKPLYFSKWSTPPISIIYSQFFTVNPC